MKPAKYSQDTAARKWANWALLREWEKDLPRSTRDKLASIITDRFRDTVSDTDPGPRMFVVRTDGGHWGRGLDLLTAIKNTMRSGARRKERVTVTLVLNDLDPWVDDYGTCHGSTEATLVYIGLIGTVGSIINAQPKKT